MNSNLRFILPLLAVLLALAGCLPAGGPSAPTHFYRLEYASEPVKVTENEKTKDPSKVLVKVSANSALKGVRMAVAESAYELTYQEFERWAEPLSQSVQRLLVEGLRGSFAMVEGVPVLSGYDADYDVSVTLEKLWGTRRGEVVLAASWIVTDHTGHIVVTGRQEFRRGGWRTGDYRQFAERVSNTIPLLVQSIRESIVSQQGANLSPQR